MIRSFRGLASEAGLLAYLAKLPRHEATAKQNPPDAPCSDAGRSASRVASRCAVRIRFLRSPASLLTGRPVLRPLGPPTPYLTRPTPRPEQFSCRTGLGQRALSGLCFSGRMAGGRERGGGSPRHALAEWAQGFLQRIVNRSAGSLLQGGWRPPSQPAGGPNGERFFWPGGRRNRFSFRSKDSARIRPADLLGCRKEQNRSGALSCQRCGLPGRNQGGTLTRRDALATCWLFPIMTPCLRGEAARLSRETELGGSLPRRPIP